MNEHDDQLLNDLIDGRLSDDEASALRARIVAEAPLRERHAALLRVGEWLREQDPAKAVDVPASFLADVTARIAKEAGDSEQQADTAAAPDTGPGGPVLRMPTTAESGAAESGAAGSGAAGSGETARSQPAALRYLGFAYAAAAVLVVGLGLGFALLAERDEPSVTELAKQDHFDAKPDRAGSLDEHAAGKEGLADDFFNGTLKLVTESPKLAGSKNGLLGGAPLGGRDAAQRGDADLAAREEQERRPVGPGGSVRPGLREPSNDPSPVRGGMGRTAKGPGENGGRKARAAPEDDDSEDASAAAQTVQPPLLLYAVHAEDPAAARAGLQLMLYQIAQAKDLRSGGIADAPTGSPTGRSKPAGDAERPQAPETPASETPTPNTREGAAPADGTSGPAGDKVDRSLRKRGKAADTNGELGQPRFELDGRRALRVQAPTFVLRRLELVALDELVAETSRDRLERLFGEWGRDAVPPTTPAPATPVPTTPAPTAPAPSPLGRPVPAPAVPVPAVPTPATPAAPAGTPSEGPGPGRDAHAAGRARQGLAHGVVDRVLTLGQLRALEARFGIRATDARFLQPVAGVKKQAQAEQLVRVRFVFVQGPAPR